MTEDKKNAAAENELAVLVDVTSADMSNTVFYNTFLKKAWLLPYVIILSLLSLAVLIAYFVGFYEIPFYLAAASAGVLLVLIFSVVATRLAGRGGSDIKKRNYTFNDTGVGTAFIDDGKSAFYKWENLFEIRETGAYLYIYLNLTDILILPKRCFEPGQLEEVRTVIQNNMEAKRYRLKKN